MEKTKEYPQTLFSADVVRDAFNAYKEQLPKRWDAPYVSRTITNGDEKWKFDSDEEFFAAYRKPCDSATFSTMAFKSKKLGNFSFHRHRRSCSASVDLPRVAQIEAVFDVFERNASISTLPDPPEELITLPEPRIFIGHGRSAQWRDLKDHLTDKHGYQVVAYEVGARAGHTIRDILDEMLVQASFALLVMTAEDETGDGQLRARQNVVHELGLFQGTLGFSRAIAIAEYGVELFSNIDGVQQLRFSTGNIAEVYGDVLATLYREFGDSR